MINAIIIDDEIKARSALLNILKRNCEDVLVVAEAEGVLLGLEAINHHNPDIVFLDIVMPQKNGIEVLKEIKSILPQLPVVMMSGYSLQEQKDEAVRLGAVGCLKKPFEVEDIRRVIKQVIGRDV